jgi:hypothetical protein
VLFGRNGAGKSTLLLIAATLFGRLRARSSSAATVRGSRRRGPPAHRPGFSPELPLSGSDGRREPGVLRPVVRELGERFGALVWADLDLRRHSPVRSLSRECSRGSRWRGPSFIDRSSSSSTSPIRARCPPPSGFRRGFRRQGRNVDPPHHHDVDRGVSIADRISILEEGASPSTPPGQRSR